jgi:hypothetical protein
MAERSANRHYGGLDLLFGCTDDPSLDGSRRLKCIGTGVEVDGSQEGVDKCAVSYSLTNRELCERKCCRTITSRAAVA